LAPADPGLPASFGDIISAAGTDWLDKEKLNKLAVISSTLDPDADDFADKIAPIDFTPAEQTKLHQTLRLGKLTQNNPALIQGLQTFVTNDVDASLKGLAAIQSDEWIDIAYTYENPAGSFMEPEVYAQQMEKEVEQRLPTASFVNRINNKYIFNDQPGITEIAKKLSDNTSFNIAKDDVKDFAKKNGLNEEHTTFIQKLQNLKKVGATWDETEVLINNGLTHIAKLAEYTPDQLKNIVGDDIDVTRIKEIYDTVKSYQALGIGVMAYFQGTLTGYQTNVMADQTQFQNKINENPTLRNLFGALEQCDCDPCMSVLSPAAYYVDLLKFIDTNIPEKTELSPAGVELRKRRPDLYDLELSCDNSEIVLPHIDLALEILENAVVFPEEILLNPGESFWKDNSESDISEAVMKKLRETSEDKLGSSFNYEKTEINKLVIADSFRRWAIQFKSESFFTGKYEVAALDINIVEMITWLNGSGIDKPTPAISDAIQKFVSNYSRQVNLLGSITSLKVTVLENGKRWKITFAIGIKVKITDLPDKGKSITIESADGKQKEVKNYNTKTIDAAEKTMATGKKPGILHGKKKSDKKNVVTTAAGEYELEDEYSFELRYNATSLAITSLTYQSTERDRDLLARAQNKNPLAYKELAKDTSVFPWSLPYDEYLTETRILLNKAGMPRLDLFTTHLPYNSLYTDSTWANEVLGLSPGQKGLIISEKSVFDLSTAWGFNIEDYGNSNFEFSVFDTFQDKIISFDRPEALFQVVSIIMQQAGIDFNELQGLLLSRFINIDNVYIPFNNDCDPTQMYLKLPDEQQYEPNYKLVPFCDRLHRFVRLLSLTGLTISELDNAIMADGIGDKVINDTTILHIAQLKTLQQKLNVPFQTVIDLFRTFIDETNISFINGKRTVTKSLYDKIFQNVHLQNPPNEKFTFSEFANNAFPLSDELRLYLACCLGLRLMDLDFLTNPTDLVTDLSSPSADTEYLHRIWRNVTLTNILQLSLTEYSAACQLISPAIAIFISPETLLNFLDEVAFVKESGIGFEELENILSYEKGEVVLPNETSNYILKGLKDELNKCKPFYFKEIDLTENMLDNSPFILPATEAERWERWGFQKNFTTDQWEINLGTTLLSGVDPMIFIKQQDLLAQQCHVTLLGLDTLLNTDFITAGKHGLLIAEINIATTKSEIKNLTIVHLDRIERFLALQSALNAKPGSLDIFLSSFMGITKEPLDYDLKELVKSNRTLILQRKNTVTNYLSKTFSLFEETVNDLMCNHFTISRSDTAEFAIDIFIANSFLAGSQLIQIVRGIRNTLIKLQKITILNSFWKASSAQLTWLRISSASIGYLGLIPDNLQADSGAVNYIDWKRSTMMFGLANSNAETEKVLCDYLNPVIDPQTLTLQYYARTEILSKAFGLNKNDVDNAAIIMGMEDAITSTNVPLDSLQFDPISIVALFNYLSVLQKSGLAQSDFELLVTNPASIEIVLLARKLLYVRSGKDFPAALKDVNDKLRIEQRDKLADYLCWRDNLHDANALYEKYLIDVEMSPCVITTRLLQATAAAQLFVYRCLMNLEDKVSPDGFDKKRWEWTENYRVWEANRRVFLYPENWLYPELRDDKTEIFKTFETHLLQNEASYQNAKEGLINYAEDLVEQSKITVMGMHEYASADGGIKLFQVGRTINPPYSFYSREFLFYSKWSGWEKIVQNLSADHIVPFTHVQDLCIAWPEIVTQNKNSKQSYEVGMFWIRKTNKGWTERKKIADKIKIDGLTNTDEKSMFLFRLNENSSDINSARIQLFAATIIKQSTPDLINSYLNPTTTSLNNDVPTNNTTIIKFYISFYRRYKNTNRYKSESYGYIYFEKLLQHPNGQKTLGGENVVEYYSPGKANDWSPAYSDSIFNYEVRNIGTNGHSFRIIFQSDKGDPAQITKDPLIEIRIENNKNYEVKWNVVIDADEDDPAPQINSGDPSPALELKGEFLLFSERDGEWKKEESTNPLTLTPPANTFFFSSGLKENISNSIYQDSNAPINLLDNAGNNLQLTKISKTGEKYLAIRSSNSYPMGFHTWSIEEGNSKMLVNLADSTSSTNISTPMMVTLTAYPEVKNIKTFASSDFNALFNIQLTDSFLNNSFGLESLEDYKVDSDILPISPYKGFMSLPFPFQPAMPYALYNWELFYHLPLLAASYLSKQHRFAEARKWFHFIFDPTTNDQSTGKERFWNFLPFRNNHDEQRVDKLLDSLSDPQATDKENIKGQIAAWLDDPFNPFAVARMRMGAFEWFTVTSYIKNLIAWGDQLFRRDTRESINESTMLYVMASNILGRRKEKMGAKQDRGIPKSYRSLGTLDEFADSWVQLSETPLAQDSLNGGKMSYVGNKIQNVASIGSTYFCVPPNDNITQLWDDVEDRLFKIRHCQNFDGVMRNLPLLDPPIDPELLIRAKAAGLSIGDAIGGMYAPLPLYRFNVMQQKAMELCNEVKSLGSAMLSAIEKKDAEHLSLLRSGQEIDMLKRVESIKQEQINEAAANIDSINKSRDNIIARILYLQTQMGVKEFNYQADGTPVVEQSYITQPSSNFDWTTGDLSGLGLIQTEVDQVVFMQTNNILNLIGGGFHTASAISHTLAASLSIPPSPADGPAKVANAAGQGLASYGTFFNTLASHYAMLEKRSGQMAGWQRRRDEWLFQAKTAVAEIKQLDKQIIASEIRKGIAEKELENHHKQIEHSQNLDEFVRSQKFSNETLYTWMESQLSNVYNAAYQIALDQAKKAEQTFHFEVGDETTKYVQPGYWDSLKKGLLAGEGLTQDLRRMEIAYLEKNKREFEITKHISLANLNAMTLIHLRKDGICNFEIPELLFEMDFPGHYFRRIKSVSISIPCIAGPYTSVSSQLTLSKSYIRKDDSNGGALFDSISPGENYILRSSSIQSIATSSGQGDSGMFELNFRDERYLPFEGAGVISDWELELPAEARQFDYNTISDVIITIRYTAKNSGNSQFKEAVNKKISDSINSAVSLLNENNGLYRLLSFKNDFPDLFYKMKLHSPIPLPQTDPVTPVPSQDIIISKTFFPYFTRSFNVIVSAGNVSFFTKDGDIINPQIEKTDNLDGTITITSIDKIMCESIVGSVDKTLKLLFNPSFVTSDNCADIFILINYKLEKIP
ncbi:MAG: neuraminidase-like domain-containing protein, partial [Bacteroidia bacterium]